jgi:type VI secretion system protein VasD
MAHRPVLGARVPIIALFVVAAAALLGCSGDDEPPPPPPPTIVQATLAASDEVNPDIDGVPSPVFVRLYFLRGADAFLNAPFSELQGNDAAVLGPDLVARKDFFLVPGETATSESSYEDAPRFIGVFAEFQNVDRAIWRRAEAVPDHETETHLINVTIGLNSEDVALQVAKQEKPEQD